MKPTELPPTFILLNVSEDLTGRESRRPGCRVWKKLSGEDDGGEQKRRCPSMQPLFIQLAAVLYIARNLPSLHRYSDGNNTMRARVRSPDGMWISQLWDSPNGQNWGLARCRECRRLAAAAPLPAKLLRCPRSPSLNL